MVSTGTDQIANFRHPEGTTSQLRVYSADHPMRVPTEQYFAQSIRDSINDVRNGVYHNLWLLVESLKGVNDPESTDSGFESWEWRIGCVLGSQTCIEIGKQVCQEQNFTLEEAKELLRQHPAED